MIYFLIFFLSSISYGSLEICYKNFEKCSNLEHENPNSQKAYEYGCSHNDYYSCTRLGESYEHRGNIRKAISLYKKACKKKEKIACEYIKRYEDNKKESLDREILSLNSIQSFDLLFKKYSKSDGNDAEEIQILIGNKMKKNPYAFLKSLKKNNKKNCFLSNLGDEFVDQNLKSKIEIKKRIVLLQGVKIIELKSLKKKCIQELNEAWSLYK